MSKKENKNTSKEAQGQMMIINGLKLTIQKQKEELGRPLFYSLLNFGCQMIYNNVIF